MQSIKIGRSTDLKVIDKPSSTSLQNAQSITTKLIPPNEKVPRANAIEKLMIETGVNKVQAHSVFRQMLDEGDITEIEYSIYCELVNSADILVSTFERTKKHIQDLYLGEKPITSAISEINSIVTEEYMELQKEGVNGMLASEAETLAAIRKQPQRRRRRKDFNPFSDCNKKKEGWEGG
jgi:hypothetical protein